MLLAIAFLWGFAEATLFFIVPDVFFTYLVLFDLRLASGSCLFALIGALIGGGLMYHWGRKNFEQVAGIVESLPGISNRLVQREKTNLREKGIGAIFLGPLKGVPYKIYAICSPSNNVPFFQFLLISIPARLSRFVLSILLTELAFHRLLPTLSLMTQMAILSGFWVIFYTGYFLKMRDFSR